MYSHFSPINKLRQNWPKGWGWVGEDDWMRLRVMIGSWAHGQECTPLGLGSKQRLLGCYCWWNSGWRTVASSLYHHTRSTFGLGLIHMHCCLLVPFTPLFTLLLLSGVFCVWVCYCVCVCVWCIKQQGFILCLCSMRHKPKPAPAGAASELETLHCRPVSVPWLLQKTSQGRSRIFIQTFSGGNRRRYTREACVLHGDADVYDC